MKQRTNEGWLSALRGVGREETLADFRDLLVRGLWHALANHTVVDEAAIEDFV